MQNIHDYIKVFAGIVPLNLCDALVNEFSGSHEWEDTAVGNGVVDKDARSAMTILLNKETIDKNAEVRAQFDAELFKVAGAAVQNYLEIHPKAQINRDTGYQLLRYETGQFYAQHIDFYETYPRSLSCSFALNDGYEGGEFAFFDREKTIRLPKGSALVFPSNFMFPHEIMPVLSGTRYSIVTWFV
jgi:predicted 2-oxoglutarate/Fe(II)-dependent dioxygenase YbiX